MGFNDEEEQVERRKLAGIGLLLIGAVVMLFSTIALQRARQEENARMTAQMWDAMSRAGSGTGSGVNVGGGGDSAVVPMLLGFVTMIAGAVLVKMKGRSSFRSASSQVSIPTASAPQQKGTFSPPPSRGVSVVSPAESPRASGAAVSSDIQAPDAVIDNIAALLRNRDDPV
jgi:hypothetical protein